MSELNKLKEKLINATSQEEIIGAAIEAYMEGDDEELKLIIKGLPNKLREELFVDFQMIDFIKEMAKKEKT